MTQVDSEPFQFGENINWMSLLRVPCSGPELDRAANCLDDGALASLPFAQDTPGTGAPTGSALTSAELKSPAEYFATRKVTPSRTTVVTHVMPVAWNVGDPAIEDDAKSDSSNATNPNTALVEPINRASNQKQGKTTIQWKLLLLETLLSTSIMHTFNLWTEAGTRDALYGPWFKDYMRSLSELRGWSDSDRFMAPYVGHSIQGSIYGFTLRQNDPKYRDVQWGDGRDYWISILRSTAFSAAAHAQWKIGPLSEASIGNVMLHASPGFITLVTTPTLGALTMIGEDLLDRYLIIGLENRSTNGTLIILARSFLNPGRSFANVMAFKKPWYRATRMGLETDYDFLIRREVVADYKAGVGPKLFEFVKRPEVSPHSESNVAAIELAAYANYERFSGRNCMGGGGSGAARINAAWQIVMEVNGCLIMGFPVSTESGDSLFYGGGPRWTPRASHKLSPYLEFLVGGRKVTYDVNDPALHALLKEEWNDGNGTLTHYPKRSDWSFETASNGASIAAGGRIPVLVLALAGPLTVCAQPSATTTVLAVNQNAVNLGTVVTLSATVTTIAAPVTVGQVQFLDGIRVLGSAQLTGAGVASLKTRSFTSGTHSLTAAYFGAPNSTQQTAASKSNAVALQVTGDASSLTTIAAAPDTQTASAIDLAATVYGLGAAPLSGSVQFLEGGTGLLGVEALPKSEFRLTPPTPSFASFPVVGLPTVGDFNGDGIPDLALSASPNGFSIWLGDPTHPGSFLAPKIYASGSVSLATGDFNGDGALDLVTLLGQDVSILPGDPGNPGQFLPAKNYSIGFQPSTSFLAVGDINGDGLPDVVVAGGGVLGILLNDHTNPGSFLTPTDYVGLGLSPTSVALGDLNGDGMVDIVVTNSDGTLNILLGDPAHPGQFLLHPTYTLGQSLSALAIADLNGDGLPDVVVGGINSASVESVIVLLNNASSPGTFLSQTTYPVPVLPNLIVVSDLNNDGLPDLLLWSAGSGAVLLGSTQAGLFTAEPQPSFSIPGISAAAAGDFNGDGVLDLVGTIPATNPPRGEIDVSLGAQASTATLGPLTLSSPGTHSLSAAFTGSALISGSASIVSAQAVVPVPSTTLLRLSNQTIASGSPLTLTATISVGLELVTTGQVTFLEGKRVLGIAQVGGAGPNAGTATLVTTSFAVGQHILTAKYSGSPLFRPYALPSESAEAGLVVTSALKVSSTMTLTSSPSVTYSTLDLTATVSGTSSGPTGTVTFVDLTTNTALGTVPLVNGPLSFSVQPAIPLNAGASIASADVNRDGLQDLIVGSGQSVLMFLNSLSSPGNFLTFLQLSYTASASTYSMVAADLNGDGAVDIVLCDGGSHVGVLFGDPNHLGQFTSESDYAIPGGNIGGASLSLIDTNGDGSLDIVIRGGYPNPGSSVLFGDPTNPGGFLTANPASGAVLMGGYEPAGPTLYSATPTLSTDLNGDGLADLVTTDTLFDCNIGCYEYGGNVTVKTADPEHLGGFLTTDTYPVGVAPTQVVAGDFNGDGVADLAVLNNDTYFIAYIYVPSISLLFGQTAGSASLRGVRVSPGDTLVATYSGDTTNLPANSATRVVPESVNIPAQFNDVAPGNAYFDAVNLMFEKGVTVGCVGASTPQTRSYCPDSTVTRGQMAAFIVRAVTGTTTPVLYNPIPYFADVQTTDPFFSDIQKLMELGITVGCATGPPALYCPDDSIPRWQMAIFMVRARLALHGASFTTNPTPYFADAPTTVDGGASFPYIQRSYEEHITVGCGTNPLFYCPDALVTRGQMASFIMRGLFNETMALDLTAPLLTGVSPNTVLPQEQTTVTITGVNTYFQAGDTVSVPSGMLDVSNVMVNSETSITLTLTPNATTVAGPQSLVVTSGGQNLTLPLSIKVGQY